MRLFKSREVGTQYETVAQQHLLSHGLTLLEKNFSCRLGELDLIMQQDECIVFIEVKYRNQQFFGNAAECVDRKKATKLIKTAHVWLKKRGLSPYSTEFRFDVVAIHQQGNDINWIKNAITEG